MAEWLTVPKTKAQIEQNKKIAQAARKQQRDAVRKGRNISLTQSYQAAAKENVSNGQQSNNKKKQKSIKKKKQPKKGTSWDESSDVGIGRKFCINDKRVSFQDKVEVRHVERVTFAERFNLWYTTSEYVRFREMALTSAVIRKWNRRHGTLLKRKQQSK